MTGAPPVEDAQQEAYFHESKQEEIAPLLLRAATFDDAQLLWHWRNDPGARAASFTTDPVPWQTHCAWLAGRLASPATRIWILMRGGIPVGQIRYDRYGEEAELSFSVAAPLRGRGLGTALLRLSGPRACQEFSVRRLTARAKAENIASLRALSRAGFRRVAMGQPSADQIARFEQVCSCTEAVPPGGDARP